MIDGRVTPALLLCAALTGCGGGGAEPAPPAGWAALLGPNRTLASMKAWMPACSVGMFAPSETPRMPFRIMVFASSVEIFRALISRCRSCSSVFIPPSRPSCIIWSISLVLSFLIAARTEPFISSTSLASARLPSRLGTSFWEMMHLSTSASRNTVALPPW